MQLPTREELENQLFRHLKMALPCENAQNSIYFYILFPPGKLFRPELAWRCALDLKINSKQKDNLYLLSSAIELHHAYTLAHDDLPAMDNDDERRGRPSAHKAYSEWQALLAGDGLLNISYGLLAQIKHPHAGTMIRLASHLTGPKGLILGQHMDLSQEMNKNLSALLLTHELKTSRLIQFSLLGSALLADVTYRQHLQLARLGRHIGLVFQLLDDLGELGAIELSKHEKDINPWPRYQIKAQDSLLFSLKEMKRSLASLPLCQDFLMQYLKASAQELEKNQKAIQEKIPDLAVGPLLKRLTDIHLL